MFEQKHQPLLSRKQFAARLLQTGVISLALISFSLLIGMLGYHLLEKLNWIDAFLNAAMLLGGMGPVNAPVSFGGKFFAGVYALYCGLIVILIAGVLLAPVAHRLLHRFHLKQSKR